MYKLYLPADGIPEAWRQQIGRPMWETHIKHDDAN